ncbi:MAG: hypothetical protein IJ071_10545 [Ruminococcus sp.]|nr:hypothetical protein [Ruminococcus sp.]
MRCNCYNIEGGEPRCWGTPERDPCNCGGDESKCDYYPYKRRTMSPESYLSQITDIDLRIRSLEGELADIDDDDDYAHALADQISADLEEAKGLRLKIRREIQNVRDHKLCTLLMEKYVRGRSWEQVADAVDMRSVKHVRGEIHRQALEAFREANENIFKDTT